MTSQPLLQSIRSPLKHFTFCTTQPVHPSPRHGNTHLLHGGPCQWANAPSSHSITKQHVPQTIPRPNKPNKPPSFHGKHFCHDRRSLRTRVKPPRVEKCLHKHTGIHRPRAITTATRLLRPTNTISSSTLQFKYK